MMKVDEYFDIVNKFMKLDNDTPIYITGYGQSIPNEPRSHDWITTITKDKLTPWLDTKTLYAVVGFSYIWGYPGPDYNVYLFEDYGKNWAFTKEEINNYELLERGKE